MDLSLVYGSDDKKAGELRTREKGELKVTARQGGPEFDLLPPLDGASPCTLPKEVSGIDPPSDVKCFKAGGW